jgi:branched-subunit amino acid permease
VSAIYGVLFGLLLGGVGLIRPSALRWRLLLGMGYGLLLWVLAMGLVLTAVGAPLAQMPAWQFGLAHLVYGLALGLWLQKYQ